jgi:transketolase C-terminal domain/subunit
MIASIASEGQATQSAPFGNALAALADQRQDIVGLSADLSSTPICTSSPTHIRIVSIRWAWLSSC